MKEHSNHLINESSPYLLQHAHNPVYWYPWGKEALAKAREENKLLIISIGYSACHWCHVMEHESFEDTAVARIMNDNFVCIKVDREERPDIDQVYMNAIQLLSGRGGWPLNAFALPDGRPFYAGTYFAKEQWLDILQQLIELHHNNPEKLIQNAEAITNGIHQNELLIHAGKQIDFDMSDLNSIFDHWIKDIDFEWGGSQGAPKFPMPVGYQFLMHYYNLTANQLAFDAVNITLTKMANGGIYDQIGGGFARYSVDKYWKVPHFEKMLYDNAQLVSLFTNAYRLTKNPLFKDVVTSTISFIESELTSPEGGFYSSLDADSEGEEGKYYVWSDEELDEILGADASLIKEYFSVKDKGNWELNNNVLWITNDTAHFLKKYNINKEEFEGKLNNAEKKLMKQRASRIMPGLDDKILTSWNALMLNAYIDAYRAFGEEKYLNIAHKNIDFLNRNLVADDGRLNRNFKDGISSINAFLDDYALLIQALINMYQATFEERWLIQAEKLLIYVDQHFSDREHVMYYYTSDIDPELIARKMELSDNVIPASNSVMAKNLYLLGELLYNQEYTKRALHMLSNMKEHVSKNGPYYANWADLMTFFVKPVYEVAIVGDNYEMIRKELDKHYLPHILLLGGKNEGSLELLKNKLVEDKTLIYVCVNKNCRMPVKTIDETIIQINGE